MVNGLQILTIFNDIVLQLGKYRQIKLNEYLKKLSLFGVTFIILNLKILNQMEK